MKRVILIVMLILFSISCTDNDDELVTNADLLGQWVLNDAICFCGFANDFDFSAHKLNFTLRKNIVIVENSNDTFFVKQSGEYSYAVVADRITIDGDKKYVYKIKDNTLTMTFVDNPQIADDELTLVYTKN